jgi:hypothetical protein
MEDHAPKRECLRSRHLRHPDHATITLPCWHQVLMNTENATRQMANVAFLD